MYSYMQMLISKIPAIACAHLALAICSLRVKIDVWPGPTNLVFPAAVFPSFDSLRQWFNNSLIREINNQYINKIELRINTQMMTGLLNKMLPVFLRTKFHTPPCTPVGELYLDPAAMWSKKAQFHNVGNGGQFCWHFVWLTLNDLIFPLHWNPDSQTRKFLLGKLQTSESHCPP